MDRSDLGRKKPDRHPGIVGSTPRSPRSTVATWSTLAPSHSMGGPPTQSRKGTSGQREYSGGPPVVRDTQDYDQVREVALAESEECQDLEKKV